MATCWFWGLVVALVGGRLLNLVLAPKYEETLSENFIEQIRQSGQSSIGALTGAGLVAVGILAVNRKNIGQYADAAVSGVFVFLALCRLGCFLNGCCFGVASDSLWGCAFEADSPAGRYATSVGNTRLVPTQLLLAAGNGGLYVLTMSRRFLPRIHGLRCWTMIALYAALRLMISYWRVE